MVSTAIKAIPLIFIDSATLGAGWVAINPNGLPNACFITRIINASSVDIEISLDGLNAHDFCRKDTDLVIPFISYQETPDYVSRVQKGQIFYVRGLAGNGDIGLAGYWL